MTQHAYRIYYQSSEIARDPGFLREGDPLLGTVQATSAEQAVEIARRHAAMTRRFMPGASLWAAPAKQDAAGQGEPAP
jgi:hypothetical protein